MIATYLFERNNLLREGLKGFLADTDYKVAGEFGGISECIDSVTELPRLLIVGVDLTDDAVAFKSQAHHARTCFPEARLVILASAEEISHMPEILHCNADGYMLRDVSRVAILSYLNIAMIGEKVFPEAVAMLLASSAHTPPFKPIGGAADLSERENEVVQCLRTGKSNKLIARDLQITESTVKGHLKIILRKLGVQNRTQAALLAVNQMNDNIPRLEAQPEVA